MYEKYICPRIKIVEFYVRTGTKHTELSTTFTVTEFAKTHLQQSRLQKKFFACGGLLSAFVICHPPPQTKFLDPPLAERNNVQLQNNTMITSMTTLTSFKRHTSNTAVLLYCSDFH